MPKLLTKIQSLIILLNLSGCIFILTANAKSRNICKSKAFSYEHSCKFLARDDYFIALALCNKNRQCKRNAKKNFQTDLDSCGKDLKIKLDACLNINLANNNTIIKDPKFFLSPKEAAENKKSKFQLKPGKSWTYRRGGETNTIRVTQNTQKICGIDTTVIEDTISIDGIIFDSNKYFYAEDINGNTWYFGDLKL